MHCMCMCIMQKHVNCHGHRQLTYVSHVLCSQSDSGLSTVTSRQPSTSRSLKIDRPESGSPNHSKQHQHLERVTCNHRNQHATTVNHLQTLVSKSPVFQHLPEPTRACLVGVYAVTLDPLLSLYGIIYLTWYTRLLPKATSVTFR